MVLVRPSQITSNNRTYTIHPDELKLPIGSLGRNITSHPSMRAKIRFHDSALSELDAVTLRWDKKHSFVLRIQRLGHTPGLHPLRDFRFLDFLLLLPRVRNC